MAGESRRLAIPRAVLGTNVVLSALLFGSGMLVRLREGWQASRFVPLVSSTTADELIRVLAYPKFRLSTREQEDLIADYLPYCAAVQVPDPPPATPPCPDPFDVPFVELAVAGDADFLVPGDGHLLDPANELACAIVNPASFLRTLYDA